MSGLARPLHNEAYKQTHNYKIKSGVARSTHKFRVRHGPKHINKHIITRLSQALPDRHTNLMSGFARSLHNEAYKQTHNYKIKSGVARSTHTNLRSDLARSTTNKHESGMA